MIRNSAREITRGTTNGHDYRRQKVTINDVHFDHNAFSNNSNGKSSAKNRVIPDDEYKLLQLYLKEIGTESLLSAIDELRTAIKIKKYGFKAQKLENVINEHE